MSWYSELEAQRMRFEDKHVGDVTNMFEDVLSIFIDVWRATGDRQKALDAVRESEATLEQMLKLHEDVAPHFALIEYESMTKAEPDRASFWTRLLSYVMRVVPKRATMTNEYSAELLDSMTAEVTLEVLEDQVEYEKVEDSWRDIALTRAERMTTSEVIAASESGRREGARASVEDDPAVSAVKKKWRANLDAAVRPTHAEAHTRYADGIDIDDAFVVGNEEMMFPADTSLGATGKNFMNCRCAAQYIKE